jgi:glutamate formiminotransferase
MAIIECVPNISEGVRTDVVATIVDALRGVPGLRVLDVQSDPTHNRSVLTLAGDAASLRVAIPLLVARTIEAVDLRAHKGEHPRMGAVDVVPFIPIESVTMADCVALAREVGQEVATRSDVPVFLYEEAAASPSRRNLEDIRRVEGLAAKMATPEWRPDYGPSQPHPSGGATVIGARMPLIAYNINLATDRLDVAKKIATAVRMSSGGLRFVKAMGLALDDRQIVQVSMNLTNFEKTPVFRVFELVKREAARFGVMVLESEIVGLVPQAALLRAAEYYLQLEGFSADQVLENKLRHEGHDGDTKNTKQSPS